MDYNNAVYLHLKNFWSDNKIDCFSWQLGRITHEIPNFRVFRITPNTQDEPWVYVSCGIGSQGLKKEFFIISPNETSYHIETLAMLASISNIYPNIVELGNVINIGRPWIEKSNLNHFLVSLPYPYGEKLEYLDELRFFWLMPITEKEKIFLEEYSVENLESMFDKFSVNYLAPSRESVI